MSCHLTRHDSWPVMECVLTYDMSLNALFNACVCLCVYMHMHVCGVCAYLCLCVQACVCERACMSPLFQKQSSLDNFYKSVLCARAYLSVCIPECVRACVRACVHVHHFQKQSSPEIFFKKGVRAHMCVCKHVLPFQRQSSVDMLLFNVHCVHIRVSMRACLSVWSSTLLSRDTLIAGTCGSSSLDWTSRRFT
jgi:hypothetical protein